MLQRTWTNEQTLANFLRWLEVQDPGEEYNWDKCRVCAVGQWLMAMGHSVHFVWTGDVERANRIAQQHPHTFGALRGRVAKQVEERR